MTRRTRKTAQTPRQQWLAAFFADECCGQPMSGAYDCVMLSCRHNSHTAEETNCYYRMCTGACGTIETLCSECVTEDVAEWQGLPLPETVASGPLTQGKLF